MHDGADDSPTASTTLVAVAPALDLIVEHPSILRPDPAAAASAAPLHDSSSSGHVSPVDNGQLNPDVAGNPQQVALPPPGKRYRSTPAKTFQCKGFGDCRMVFSRSEHLARHIRKHTGERPFQCHCAKQFSRLDNLRQHAQTVHADKPDLNEKMMKELTTLHTSMSAASGTTKRANKRGKNAQADPIVPPNSNYGLNGAGSRNGANGPYDPPPPDPYANAPGAPGWQPPVGHATTYVNPAGYHTQYVEGQYAAFPLTEAFPSTPTYAHHHPHHPHHPSQSYAVQHHGYAPSSAAAVQGYDYPPHSAAQRHSDPDSPLSNGHPPASASELASPLTPTSAHAYTAYHQHQHHHPHPHQHPRSHSHSHQQQHSQHLTAATAYAGHPHGMSPVPTPPPQSFRPPLHGVRDGAGGGELYPPSVHASQYSSNGPNGASPYIPGEAAGAGVGVPARAVVVPGEHAQLGVHRFGPGISIPTGIRGNGPPTAATVTTPIDEQHPAAYALSGGGPGGHPRLAQQQYYHPQQQQHHAHEQQQQFEGANGGYHPAVVARPSYSHHRYEDEQHQHQHQHHLAAPARSDGGRSPIEAFSNLGQPTLRTASTASSATAVATQSSRAMAEYHDGISVGDNRASSSPPFRYTLPADNSIPPVRGSPTGGPTVYGNSPHGHSHGHRGYRLSASQHHSLQQQHQQLSTNGSSSAPDDSPFSFHPPPLNASAPGAGIGGGFYRSRPATAQGTGSESRPQSRRLAIMDLCDNPGDEGYDIRPRTAGGVVQRRPGPGGSSPSAPTFAFSIIGGGGLAPPSGGGGFSSRPTSSAGRAAGLEQYAVVSGSSRPGTSAGGNGNGGGGFALAPLRIDASGISAAAHGHGHGGGGGEEDGDGDEDADGDADGDA